MPKPASQSELLAANDEAFQSLKVIIGSFSAAQLSNEFPFPHRDRNVRDVLAHLYEWQQMFFRWYRVGMTGKIPVMPAPGYTWKTTPALNHQIWQEYQSWTFTDLFDKLNKSHRKLQGMIRKHTNEELFTKRRYSWTGSTSLGVYMTGAGWSHYHWALKLLRRVHRSN